MRKQTVRLVFWTIVAMPFMAAALVLLITGILLKAAGRMCALDIAGAKHEIRKIKSILSLINNFKIRMIWKM